MKPDVFRGEVRWALVTFPLTPALSLGARENPPLPLSTTQRGVCPTNLPNKRNCRRLFPLPEGEGWGEGNGDAGCTNRVGTSPEFKRSNS